MRLRIFLIWGALMLSGCKKDDPQILIDEWNASFAPLKTACDAGDKTACQSACTLSRQQALCTRVRLASDMNDPQQKAWVDECIRKSLSEANTLCAAAALPASVEEPSPVAPPIEPPLPEAPDPSLKESKSNGVVSEAAKDATVNGAIPKEVIRRIVRTHLQDIKLCYERALTVHGNLEGRLKVRFIISGTGQILSADVGESTLGSPEAERCVTDAVKRWVFPKPTSGSVVIVVYPFDFKVN